MASTRGHGREPVLASQTDWRQGLDSPRDLVISLSGPDYRALAVRARADAVEPADLAALWIADRLRESADVADIPITAAEAHEVRVLLERHRELVPRALERIERLEQLSVELVALLGSQRLLTETPAASRTAPGSFMATGEAPLHEEIDAVLMQAGRPLTTTEIADGILRRGRYRARKRGPVTAGIVRGRVIHPRYRQRYTRSGRLVGLREWDTVAEAG